MDGSGGEHSRLSAIGQALLDSVHFVYSVHLCPLHSGYSKLVGYLDLGSQDIVQCHHSDWWAVLFGHQY